jgi:hypothetical protein
VRIDTLSGAELAKLLWTAQVQGAGSRPVYVETDGETRRVTGLRVNDVILIESEPL